MSDDDRKLSGEIFDRVLEMFPSAADLAVSIERERDELGHVRAHVTIKLDLLEPMAQGEPVKAIPIRADVAQFIVDSCADLTHLPEVPCPNGCGAYFRPPNVP